MTEMTSSYHRNHQEQEMQQTMRDRHLRRSLPLCFFDTLNFLTQTT